MAALDNPNHEKFAQRVVACGNKSQAYREVFPGQADNRPHAVWSNASDLAARPDIARRIDELLAESATTAVADHAAAVQYAWDVATADPNEISRTFYTACRCCHGAGNKFQWRDPEEYDAACNAAAEARKPLPSCDGGFGFDAHAEPSPTCTVCMGIGERHDWYCDPTKLTGKAAKLYAGLHPKTGRPYAKDQDAAWDRVCRLMGWNKEIVKIPQPTTAEDNEPMTPEKAERQYLELVRGGRAA